MEKTKNTKPKPIHGQKKPRKPAVMTKVPEKEKERPADPLRASEEKFRRLFETAQDGILLLEAETGFITDANPFFEKILGYSREEMVGKKLWEIGPFEDISASREAFRDLQKMKYIHYKNLPLETKDGQRCNVEFVSNVYKVGKQKVIQCNIRDITERVQVETVIVKANRVNAVISQINEMVVRAHDQDEIFAKACRIAIEYGKFRMAWIGLVDEKKQMVKPIAWEGVEQEYLTKIKKISIGDVPEGHGPTGTAIREKRTVYCDDIANDPRMLPWRKEALKRGYGASIALPMTVHGKTIGAFTIYAAEPFFFNTTENRLLEKVTGDIAFALEAIDSEKRRKQAEEALLESEKRYRELFENAGLAIFQVTRDGKPITGNPEFARMFGYASPEDFLATVGNTANLFADPRRRAEILRLKAENPDTATFENLYRRKDGSTFLGQMTMREVNNPDGQAEYLEGVIEDITARKRGEEEIRILSKFPAENPNPILRIARNGRILYANQVSGPILAAWGREVGQEVPGDWCERIESAMGSGKPKEVEVDCQGRIFSCSLTPIANEDYVNIYGRDMTERKQAEDALHHSEESYRTLAEAAHDNIFVVNRDGYIEYVNEFAASQFGRRPEEIIGQKMVTFFPPEVGHHQLNNLEHTFQTGEPYYAERKTVFSMGEVWLGTWISPLFNEAGDVRAVLGIARDITERMRVEAELEAERNLLHTLVDNLPDAIYIKDTESRFLLGNSAVARVMGAATPDELIGKTDHDFFPEELATQYLTGEQEIIQSGKAVINREEQIIYPDGSQGWVLTNQVPLRDQNGSVVGLVGIGRTITERKRAEEALHAISSRQEALLASIPDIVMEVDVNKVYTWANPAGLEFFGEEVIGREAAEYFEGNQDTYQIIKPLFKGDENTIYVESWQRRRDGQKRLLAWWCRTLKNEHGKVVGALSSARDITEISIAQEEVIRLNAELEQRVEARTRELRDAQEKLIRQEKLAVLGQLAGSVGHELRNPLGIINNAIYYLRLVQPEADDKVKEYMGIIESETRTADKIISDLLDFSRIKSVDREPVRVADLVERSLERFPVPGNVSVTFNLREDLPTINVDLHQMTQVLGNLIVNASQAMPKGGELTISATRKVKEIAIAVKDTGVGIPPENMGKLFEPLFTTKPKGIGLGLAVTKILAEANSGRIETQSEPDKGSTFTVYLPDGSENDTYEEIAMAPKNGFSR